MQGWEPCDDDDAPKYDTRLRMCWEPDPNVNLPHRQAIDHNNLRIDADQTNGLLACGEHERDTLLLWCIPCKEQYVGCCSTLCPITLANEDQVVQDGVTALIHNIYRESVDAVTCTVCATTYYLNNH